MKWFDANNNPPKSGGPHEWSREVVAITDFGNAYRLRYMPSSDEGEGHWERPESFDENENVLAWTEFPEEFFE